MIELNDFMAVIHHKQGNITFSYSDKITINIFELSSNNKITIIIPKKNGYREMHLFTTMYDITNCEHTKSIHIYL